MGQWLNLSPVQSLSESVMLGKYSLDKYRIVAYHDTVFCRFFYKQTNRNASSEKNNPILSGFRASDVKFSPQLSWSFIRVGAT